ncbi:hypothetical protein EMIHUDRAFT_222647 [Emiliania huxleyi CCMP1516]|uniref:Uncharacterized protein n=2 Tax=Emiliania huxleyi TaxID=2903 RepID=A0A0D3KXR0_EMIH1|nr:hypothetical protein EMIHUDRAFT_222647 [Emiliania huxleyi CCMP1516]EOD40545.1 hypothetical protein EMIHUDRAFT_222647 [Emiliania huxleyi CCMP1516]|eukprot:XP_005792974.1 hypothetical protein EMIHUDRAFT_222647 [Emiliania huxleyi CCMP1516]
MSAAGMGGVMEGLIENSERPTLPDPALMQLVAASASLRHLTGPLATVTWEELAADCAPPSGEVRLLSAPPPAPPSQDRVTAEAARALSGSLSSLFAMLEERDEELRRLRGQLELSQRRGRKLQALLNEAYDKEAASIIDAALKGTQQILTAQAAAGCGNDRPLDAGPSPVAR